MAVFRMFYINFWRNAFIMDFTPEEKYFYIYLMTNPNTNHCGIYQISKKTMCFETGFNEEKVNSLLTKLTEQGYIKYCEISKEIIITNWIKENFINSPNTIKNLNGELKKVVNKDFLEDFYDVCVEENYPLDKLFKGISLKNSSSIVPLQCENPSPETNDLEETDDDFKNLIKLFNNNIHPITPLEYVKLQDWSKDIDSKAIEIAILEAVNHNARSMSYINCILNNWLSLGIHSKEQVENHQKQWNEKQVKEKYYCTPNASAYDCVEFPEIENSVENNEL